MPVHFDDIGEGLTDILTVVKKHPKHVAVIATDSTNVFCTSAMLQTILTHQAASIIGALAGFTSIVPLNNGAVTIVGYTEAIQSYFRENLTEIAFLSPEELIELASCDLTVFTPTENGLQFSLEHTKEYVPFVQSLKVGDKVRCIINGFGEVTKISTECCDNENCKPEDKKLSVLTITGLTDKGEQWTGTYLEDGTNISQAYTGRTLRPLSRNNLSARSGELP